MIMPALWRNAHEANYHGKFRRIGLLIDDSGIPAHRSGQHWASSGLQEVGVRLGMRHHHVNGIAGQRQPGNMNPDHVYSQIGGISSTSELAGWGLRTRPYLLKELDETAGSEIECGQDYRRVRIDVVDLDAVNDQVLERGPGRTKRRVKTRCLCGSHSTHNVRANQSTHEVDAGRLGNAGIGRC